MKKKVSGIIIDILNRRTFPGTLQFDNKVISKILEDINIVPDQYILPGLIDAHVHIESSMLTPGGFAKLAVKHGTVASVSDPHEIANVLGIEGIEFMLNDGEKVPFKFYFGAPSCVPATTFETSGATLGPGEVRDLIERKDIWYMSEMMNFPGVISGDNEVADKIQFAKKTKKPVDGHAPGLRGKALDKYIKAGISTDHECYTLEEAEEKIEKGMIVQIREGSAARNFNSLYSLIDKYPGKVMLCSDDLHPDDLMKGHINRLIVNGLNKGLDLFDLLTAATVTPKLHYNLDVGLLKKDDPADFIIIDKPESFRVKQTYINGEKVYDQGKVLFRYENIKSINKFFAQPVKENDIKVVAEKEKIRIINAFDGELITRESVVKAKISNNQVIADPQTDVLKIVALNRYERAKPVVGFITGFGLKIGALASSIAHDSHNLIAIGTSDKDIVTVLNKIIEKMGGIAISDGMVTECVELKIAGLMSDEPPEKVASAYEKINRKASEICTKIKSPFMTLSFMALLVIPDLKISDRGLFNVSSFEHTSLFVD